MKVRLGDYVKIRTGKLDANAAAENGVYPFFTCAVEPLRIDTFSYNCECVLVAGNGDLNVKYYNGKFDAYQRTYIIESKNKETLSVPYIYCFLDKYIETLREQAIGGVIKYIKLGNLTEAQIELLPSQEQTKVVEDLNKVNNLIEKRKQQLEKLDLLVKSKFIEMFGGVNESDKFHYQPVKSFAKVTSGGTPDRKNTEYWQNGTIRWVKTTELQNSIIYNTEEKITEAGMNNSSTKKIPANSILIAMYGQGKTRGMTGYLAEWCTTNQACACILPSKKVNQIYLWQFLILSYNKLREMAKGGNQPNLNAGIIKEFPILMPPIELQNEFAAFIEKTDKAKLTIKQSLERFDILKKALMQKYFG